jgi:hypothetical protein
MFLYYKIDEILVRSGFNEMQLRTWQIHLRLNRIAICVLLSGEPNFLQAVWCSLVLSQFLTQPDLANSPFQATEWLQTQLRYPRYERLRGLASLQHEQGYYKAARKRIPYVDLFERIPILEMACLTVALALVLGGLALVGISLNPFTETGAWYATAMFVTGLLVSLAICLSSYFQARLYLPVFSLLKWACCLRPHWQRTFSWKVLRTASVEPQPLFAGQSATGSGSVSPLAIASQCLRLIYGGGGRRIWNRGWHRIRFRHAVGPKSPHQSE